MARLSRHPVGDEDDDDSARNHTRDTSKDNDSDFDNDQRRESRSFFDADDRPLRSFGEPATPTERRAIATLVKRYLAAAANADGASACKLMYSLLAGAIAEDYGQPPGPAYMRGTTCAEVMSKLFAHDHTRLTAQTTIKAIRVRGFQGRVLLGSTASPAKSLTVRRELGAWKVDALLAGPLP